MLPPSDIIGWRKKADIGASAKRQKSLQEDNYLDHARSVAVRMFPVASTLGIAEGIETALSAYQIYKVNTRATMTANFMKKFRVPAGVKHLIILLTVTRTALRVWLLPTNALTQIWWLK